MAEALSKSGGGGGGLLGSIASGIGAIFGGGSTGWAMNTTASSINASALASLRGRASGGRVNAGEMYRVNEAGSPGNVEAFIPQGSGSIVPLGQMNALAQSRPQTSTVKIVVEEAPGFASRVSEISGGVAVEVHRVTRQGLIDAAAQETLRRASRPRM